MEGIRSWCSLLCYGAVGCCAVQLLVPDKGTGKLFRLVVITFFLCCAIIPLLKSGTTLSLSVDFLPQTVVDEALNDRVNEQLKEQVETVVKQLTQEALENRNVVAEKIEVDTDISENGSIYISQVVIFVDKQNIPAANVVGEMLEKQWNTVVKVTGGNG